MLKSEAAVGVKVVLRSRLQNRDLMWSKAKDLGQPYLYVGAVGPFGCRLVVTKGDSVTGSVTDFSDLGIYEETEGIYHQVTFTKAGTDPSDHLMTYDPQEKIPVVRPRERYSLSGVTGLEGAESGAEDDYGLTGVEGPLGGVTGPIGCMTGAGGPIGCMTGAGGPVRDVTGETGPVRGVTGVERLGPMGSTGCCGEGHLMDIL